MPRQEGRFDYILSAFDPKTKAVLDRVQGERAMRLCACAVAESAARDCGALDDTAASVLAAARAHALGNTTKEDLQSARRDADSRAHEAEDMELQKLIEYEAGNISHEEHRAFNERLYAWFAIVYCADPDPEKALLYAVYDSTCVFGQRTEEEQRGHYIEIISQFAS